MKLIYLFLLSVFVTISLHSTAQTPTFGLLKADPNATEGYTLFTPQNNTSVYLIDNCGEKINEWTFSEEPRLSCYLLENGNLLRAGKDSLEIRSWGNTLIWSYAMTDNNILQHHDIEPLPNGNILCVVADRYSDSVVIAEGRDPLTVVTNLKLEKIVEIQPVGSNDATIVWEWKFFDHLIQEFDSTKANYGVVADAPELLDLNYVQEPTLLGDQADYIHLNAVDYNAELDQIMFSSKHMHEIYIVDHSTTMAESASHTGGNSNRGGDFLWRWGNPQVYQQGSAADQILSDQHDCKWIPSAFPDSGKISVFNNNGDSTATFSSLLIIAPEFVGNSYTMGVNNFLPLTYDWSWNGSILGSVVHENKKCGMQVLSSGNVLFCESAIGRITEITRSGDHIWSYRNPTHTGGAIYTQFDIVSTSNMTMFRGERYEPTYSGLSGQNLTPQGIIEDFNPLTANCVLGNDDLEISKTILVVNPVENGQLIFSKELAHSSITIINTLGQKTNIANEFSGTHLRINIESGVYFLHITTGGEMYQQKILVN